MAESYQAPPFSHSVPQQPQQGMASWYPPPPHPYQSQQHQQQQQQPLPPPQQQHNMQWPAPPPGDQSYNYSQPLPYHSQGDYYSQQQPHQYPPPHQTAPPQFTYSYGPQDQVWQANSNWGYQQWAYPGQNASLTQEEVWAAKARAWAASKAPQNETKPVQPGPIAHQSYQDYFQQQDPQMLNTLEGQQYSLQPPGQESAATPTLENVTNQYLSKPLDQPVQGMNLEQSLQDVSPMVTSNLGFDKLEQNAMLSGVKPQSSDLQAVPSSHGQDISQSYGLDDATAAPPGAYRLDSISQQGPLQPSVAPRFTQQQPHLLAQSQTSPHVSQPQFNYTEQPSTSGYELHHQQQQQIPPIYQQQQQQQQPPQLQQQSQYPPPSMMEGLEAEFGLSPASMQNWAPAGGPGMPFPPAMGAGTSQFDHLHATHQIPVPMFGRSHGPQQGVGFPSGGPFVAGGGPALGPGPGAPARPMFIPDGFGERPKKAAVPSWLREELLKKKTAGLAGNSTGMLLSDDSSRVNGGEAAIHLNQRIGISDRLRTSSPGLSDDEEDNEEAEVEAARNAAINQEIKRLLTEVLMKVTGDLFEEIAQEVLEEEDDETFEGKPHLDEQDKTSNPISPPSLAPAPSMPARVLVSSLKNHGTNDDGDKDSGASGSAAGDVLGLGEYASDEDDIGTKDHQMSVKVLETRREPRRKDLQENVSVRMDIDLDHSDRKVESREIGDVYRGNSDGGLVVERQSDKEKYRDKDLIMKTYSGKVVSDKDVEREKRRYQEGEKKRSQERNTRSPEPAQASLKEYHVDARNGTGHLSEELAAPISQGNLSIVKEEHRRAPANNVKETDSDYVEAATEQDGRKTVKDRSTLGSKGDKQHQDKRQSKADSKERPVLGKESSSAANKISSSSVQKNTMKEMSNTKERESLSIHKSADASGLEKKREERTADNNRKKGTETVRNDRSSDAREKDSNRDRRKEKAKEKEKLREKEHERERRKIDKGKRERESRSKRRDAMEKKNRHRSSSSSSRHTESRSSSSSSHDSRGRSHAWRSNRRHSSISSPGRSKKRRSASKSPVYRRRHS